MSATRISSANCMADAKTRVKTASSFLDVYKRQEKICELDDDLMMAYLEGEEPSVDELKKVLRKATCECQAIPVCCGTARCV